MEWAWLLLLLPVASFSGYALGKQSSAKLSGERVEELSKQYFIGLNHLLNEEQDQAIALFERIVDKDTDRFETQLALGSLFRRRGELERAIRLHQDLSIRPQLTPEQRCIALLELGDDFVRAGLLDRAESLFDELLLMDEQSEQALRQLQKIYEQEQDWRRAIAAAEKRARLGEEGLADEIAHFYCEMAAIDPATADEHLQAARNVDPESVRVALLSARSALAARDVESCTRELDALIERDAAFIPEAVKILRELAAIDRPAAITSLQQAIKSERGVSALLAHAELLAQTDLKAATTNLRDALERSPKRSVRVLRAWLQLSKNDGERCEEETADLNLTLSTLTEIDKNALTHRCSQCGFGTQQQHWLCPSCRNWNTTKPMPVL